MQNAVSKPTWMKFYVADWLMSEAGRLFTLEEQGAYLNLLCQQFNRGGYLPNREDDLSKLAHCADMEQWARVRERVMSKFRLTDDGHQVFNERVSREHERVVAAIEQGRAAGRAEAISDEGDDTALEATESLPPAGCTQEQFQAMRAEVWAYFLEKTDKLGTEYSFTPLRRQRFRAIFLQVWKKTKHNEARTLGAFRHAIDNLTTSDWHMGRDPKTNGKRYSSWEKHLLRSWEQFEDWLGR